LLQRSRSSQGGAAKGPFIVGHLFFLLHNELPASELVRVALTLFSLPSFNISHATFSAPLAYVRLLTSLYSLSSAHVLAQTLASSALSDADPEHALFTASPADLTIPTTLAWIGL
jgi:hypothetical protein